MGRSEQNTADPEASYRNQPIRCNSVGIWRCWLAD